MKTHIALASTTAVLTAVTFFSATAGAAPGDVYFSDYGGNINRITPGGSQSVFAAGVGMVSGLAFDGSGNLFAADYLSGAIYKLAPDGSRTTFATGLNGLWGLAFDHTGQLFVASTSIRKYAPDGSYSTFASAIGRTMGLVIDSTDNVFVTVRPQVTYQIYEYTPSGAQSVFGNDAPPGDLALDPSGNLFASARQLIYRFTPDGTRTTFASGSPFISLAGLVSDAAGDLLVADSGTNQIYQITPDGTVSTFVSELASAPLAITIAHQVPEPFTGGLLVLGASMVLWRGKRGGSPD